MMVRAMKSRLFSTAVIGFTMLGMLASPVAAEVITGEFADVAPSIDPVGNANPALGGVATEKVFKFTRLKLIMAVVRAHVTNQSGHSQVFRNVGLPIIDPETFAIAPAKRDVVRFSRHAGVGGCL